MGRFLGKLEIISSPLLNKTNYVDIIVSKDKDTYLIHTKHSNEFIVQGNSKQELLEKLAIRFPFTHFMVSDKNMKEMGLLE